MNESNLLAIGALKTQCSESLLGYCNCSGSKFNVNELLDSNCPLCSKSIEEFYCSRCESKFTGLPVSSDHACKSIRVYQTIGKIAFHEALKIEVTSRKAQRRAIEIEVEKIRNLAAIKKQARESKLQFESLTSPSPAAKLNALDKESQKKETIEPETTCKSTKETEEKALNAFMDSGRSPFQIFFITLFSIIGLLLINAVLYGNTSIFNKIGFAILAIISFIFPSFIKIKHFFNQKKGSVLHPEFLACFLFSIINALITVRFISGGDGSILDKLAFGFWCLISFVFICPLYFGRSYGKGLLTYCLILCFGWWYGLNFPTWLGFPTEN